MTIVPGLKSAVLTALLMSGENEELLADMLCRILDNHIDDEDGEDLPGEYVVALPERMN